MRSIHLLLLLFISPTLSAQSGSEIILFDVSFADGISLSNPKNITNHNGYDNQPFFFKNDIYYSSADSGQMDIKKYNYITGKTSLLTNTPENEFSPTVMPGEKYFSCILQRKDGRQDLVKYPLKGGIPQIIIGGLKVGYHTWIDKDHLLLFVLEDTAHFGLHYYNTRNGKDTIIAMNIGRSLHHIPNTASFSYVQKSENEWTVNRFDPSTLKTSKITAALPNSDFIAWTNKGILLTSSDKGIYYRHPISNEWKQVKVNGITLKSVTRLAFNPDNSRLAAVISE